ncbi:MAG: hypothetical protein RJA10_3708 [Pseudomonadota bacterium]|jgi:pimeloyl-ACP methyl ester carboxylesterase
MRPWRLAWATALLMAGLSGAVAAPALQLQPCRLKGVEHSAQCGVLKRPLDPAAPAGPAIELHVAVLPALSRHKRPDPLFFFAGGPGQSAIGLAGPVSRLLGRFANRRDLILIDQRGTGRSAALACDGDDRPQRPLSESVDLAAVHQALARCRQALQQLPHGDLRHYTTAVAMQDAEAVRQALGLGRINLVGVSYGTRAALDYLRQFPQSVRRVVLDGVAPPDMVLPLSFAADAQVALKALFDACRADAACEQRHPRLDDTWRSLRASLPRDVAVTHPLTGLSETLRLTPDALAGLVRAALYAPSLAAGLPAALAAAAEGRWAPLVGLAAALSGPGAGGGLSQGMHFSVVCAEDLPRLDRATPAPATDFGSGLADLYVRACDGWPRGEVPAAFYSVLPSASPVLLLSGAADPVTPARHGQRVAQALGARALHVVVPNAGHGVMGLGCLRDLVFRFVDAADDDAALALETGCAKGVPRPLTFTPPGAAASR